MNKPFAVIFTHAATESTEPKIAALVFINTRYIIITEAFLFGETGKPLAIVFTHTAISTKPQIAAFIYQYTGYQIAFQALFLGKMSKAFAIVLAYSSACCGDPQVAIFILNHTP